MKTCFIFIFFIILGIGNPVHAQHLDEIVFGDEASEMQHGLTTFSPSKTVINSGGLLNQTNRFLLPNTENPFQGAYTGIYGGEINITLKVDGESQNYFTVKFSGSEGNDERIIMEVEGKEVGNRYHSNEDYFLGELYKVGSGSFCFRTMPIPRSLTDGKEYVKVRLRSTGRFYGYGTQSQYATYQRAMTGNTIGLYKMFVHTNPGFTIPKSELGGKTPSYAASESNAATSLVTFKERAISNANSYFTSLLNGSDFVKTDPNNYYHPVEALAQAYFIPEISEIYQKQSVVDKLLKFLDNMVINNYNNGQTASTSWGGAFGRQGYAMSMIFDKISQSFLNEVVDLGGGAGKTRREQWCETFKSSFDFGAGSRKTITNQEMECAASVYGAALALYKLDATTYATYPAIGLRMVQEACGIKEFTGNVTNLNSTDPQLGNPANSNKGAGYFWMTEKGTSHEPGWVGPDCYGNLGGKMMEMYKMTVHHLGDKGDMDILQMAVKHVKTQALFTYPFVGSDGKKDILGEGYICYRNQAVPGESFYTSYSVAGISKDEALLGYLKQAIKDGRFQFPSSDDFKHTSSSYIFETIETLNTSNSTIQVPTTPGEPDFCFADEENGVVSIKKGEEQLMFNFYYREEADNRLVRGHHITTDYQRFLELKTDKTEARYTSSYRTRNGWVNGPSTSYGTPPDNPTSAYEGQIEYYNSYDGINYNTGRLLKDYYFLRYGKFLIAMNTLADASKTIEFPNELVGTSAWQFHTKKTEVLPATMQLPPRSTYVFILDESTTQAGLVTDNTTDISANKDVLKAAVDEKETFAQLPQTASTISLVGVGGKYKPDLFLRFMRELSYAKAIANNPKATQAMVDAALVNLNEAYSTLINETFIYDPCSIPGMVDFDKKIATGGTITIGSATGDIGSTRQGAYVVVPLLATTSGNYIVTVKAVTTRGSDISPRINLALIDESTDFVNYKVDEKNSKLIKQESSWSNYSEYKWSFDLNADDLKFMRLTFLVNDAGWAVNVGDIVFKLSSSWDRLQGLISNAQEILDTFSNPNNPEYASVSDEDRDMLKSAIENAKTISLDASDDDCNNGMNTLQSAIDRFYEAITTMNMIPGAINLSSYEETFGSIKVGDIIDATKNNSGIIYKVRPRTDGIYIPSISAATNTEPKDNPQVNISVSSDLEALKEQDANPDNSVLVEKGANGWNTFKTYHFPETAQLCTDQDYYVLLRFLTNVNWCVNLNALSMTLKDTETSNKDIEIEKTVTFYPNPASNYITINCGGRIVITDLKGIVCIERQVAADDPVDVSSLAPGFYLINIISDGKLNVAKMIKK